MFPFNLLHSSSISLPIPSPSLLPYLTYIVSSLLLMFKPPPSSHLLSQSKPLLTFTFANKRRLISLLIYNPFVSLLYPKWFRFFSISSCHWENPFMASSFICLQHFLKTRVWSIHEKIHRKNERTRLQIYYDSLPAKNVSFIPKALMKCIHVYIQDDRINKMLEAPFSGPFLILHRFGRCFKLQYPSGKTNMIFIDRLKPAYLPSPASTLNGPF